MATKKSTYKITCTEEEIKDLYDIITHYIGQMNLAIERNWKNEYGMNEELDKKFRKNKKKAGKWINKINNLPF